MGIVESVSSVFSGFRAKFSGKNSAQSSLPAPTSAPVPVPVKIQPPVDNEARIKEIALLRTQSEAQAKINAQKAQEYYLNLANSCRGKSAQESFEVFKEQGLAPTKKEAFLQGLKKHKVVAAIVALALAALGALAIYKNVKNKSGN